MASMEWLRSYICSCLPAIQNFLLKSHCFFTVGQDLDQISLSATFLFKLSYFIKPPTRNYWLSMDSILELFLCNNYESSIKFRCGIK